MAATKVHGLSSRKDGFGVRRIVFDPFQVGIRVWFQPCYVDYRARWQVSSGGWQLVRQKALPVLAAGERIQAAVCGYFIKPRSKGPALVGLKVVEASPGTQIRLLYEVLRFFDGAQHAVTVHVEFAAERFRESSKLLLPFRASRLMCRSICHRKTH
jgi:hypothetical protein